MPTCRNGVPSRVCSDRAMLDLPALDVPFKSTIEPPLTRPPISWPAQFITGLGPKRVHGSPHLLYRGSRRPVRRPAQVAQLSLRASRAPGYTEPQPAASGARRTPGGGRGRFAAQKSSRDGGGMPVTGSPIENNRSYDVDTRVAGTEDERFAISSRPGERGYTR